LGFSFRPFVAAELAFAIRNQLVSGSDDSIVETAKVMRTYTTTQIAPLLDQERAKVDQSVQNMEQVLDIQVPAALQKAMSGLPVAKERQVSNSARQQLANIVQALQKDASEPQFLRSRSRSTRRRKHSTISGKPRLISPTRRRH
jgi:hypothetical protein